jgi:predicted glycogen debranching enzyme
VPVDRHVFIKRCRAWIIADRFLTALDGLNLQLCEPGPPARWQFVANAGDGRTLDVALEVDMLEDRNTVVMRWTRSDVTSDRGEVQDCSVNLVLRFDLEDRNFHWETKRNPGADHHFSTHCRPLVGRPGFEFTPAQDRILRVFADSGEYRHSVEWSENVPHPFEQSRGQVPAGDAFSPGWFSLPLAPGKPVAVVSCADPADPSGEEVLQFSNRRKAATERQIARAGLPEDDAFGQRLALAASQFVVRRGDGKTVIAGYPWFLDWGRDTFICGRGLLAAGLISEVRDMLVTFGRFEENGTLPNSIFGDDASNRDTSDAPLWFGILCEEAAALSAESLYDLPVNPGGRLLRQVLKSIAEHYLLGTPNGIHADAETALIWSPSHFTWMDTNYPAGTPREGYPVEIQVLWIRLLRHLARIDAPHREDWTELANRCQAAFTRLFWIEAQGYFSDCLLARPRQTAADATPDTALRSNYLFAISLGLISGEQARRSVDAALKHLVVPGALRSLAPLPVAPPLPIHAADGRLLNNPREPYWGHYEGDEDTRRKPAYHNGTAWTWTFPSFCEALVRAWDCDPRAVAAAKAYLSSVNDFLGTGCLGHIPEILDGDKPHRERGCDAQAWGVTEALRVWKWLQTLDPGGATLPETH